MRKAIVGLGAALMLAGCSANTQTDDQAAESSLTLPATSSASEAATETSAEPSEPATNQRGNLVKALGEEGGVTNAEGAQLLTFSVDSITPDAPCNSDYGSAPENGHLLGISIRVSTSPEMTADNFFTLGAYDFSYIGPDGVTQSDLGTMSAFTCVGDALFTQDTLGPAQQYTGTVYLDVTDVSGTLIFNPGWGQVGGWEYSF